MKKILCTILIIAMLCTAVFAATFSDVPAGKWYSAGVEFCAAKGYVTGYTDGTFKPGNSITRAELAAVMNKMLSLSDPAKNTFEDIPAGKWYTAPVLNCVRAGIITGYSEKKFGPSDNVTREQAAVILAKAFNVKKESGRTSFADDAKISGWAVGSVKAMAAKGLVSGTGSNQFSPKAKVTRGQICTMINTAVNKPSAPDTSETIKPTASPNPKNGETEEQANALARAKEYLEIIPFSRDGLVDQLEFDHFSHEDAVYAADHCGADWREQACKKAKQYLKSIPFSYQELVDQLEFDHFSHDDAVYAVDHCGADWREQACKKAKQYLKNIPFSYQGLVDQLESDYYSHDDAVYAVDHCGANWNEQAALKAKSYLKIMPLSRDELINQLMFDHFTKEQAEYGVSKAGL